MNKKRQKQIRELARVFPESVREVRVKEIISFEEYRKMKPDEIIVENAARYKYYRIITKVIPLDHSRALRKFFDEYGADEYYKKYCEWFINHHRVMKEKYEGKLKKRAKYIDK